MKKSTAKTSAAAKTAAPAKKTVTTSKIRPAPKPKAAKPKTSTAKITAEPAPKSAPKPALKTPKVTAKKTKTTPSPITATTPSPAATPAPISTTITAAFDVGFGNFLTLRGEGAGLSWSTGLPLSCQTQDRWSITLPETDCPVICKFLLNDEVWNTGENFTVLPGSNVVLNPVF